MSSDPPVSVLLPTVSWTDAIDEIAGQLGAADELLVICDAETDPVAEALPADDSVRLVVAGEPEGCSGKANAIAAGMEAASHDRFVWTDDDFEHSAGWLDRLREDYDDQGPTTELPFFAGRDPLSVLFEPLYTVAGTMGPYLGDIAWGGAVIFDRDDLSEPETFVDDMRRALSDDGLLTDRTDITPVTRVRRVGVGGTIRESLERHVRFTKISRHYDPAATAVNGVVGALTTVSGVLFPLPTVLVLTAVMAAVYAAFGLRRWTFLLAYPAVMVSIPLMLYGLARRTFVWGSRRYRWTGKLDVEVVGPA